MYVHIGHNLAQRFHNISYDKTIYVTLKNIDSIINVNGCLPNIDKCKNKYFYLQENAMRKSFIGHRVRDLLSIQWPTQRHFQFYLLLSQTRMMAIIR